MRRWEGRMPCDRCAGKQFTKAGRNRQRCQLYRWCACGRRLTTRSGSAFRGYRFPDEVLALTVRWYLRFRRSYADVVEWLAGRGIELDASTVYDWVRVFTPASSVRYMPTAQQSVVAGAWMRPTSRSGNAGTTCFG